MKAFTPENLITTISLLCFTGYLITATNTCSWGKYQCKNGKCIKHTFRCDNGDDCGDNSDEEGCGERCLNRYFRCSNGKCISRMSMCEGDDDCGDNSDETPSLCGTGSAPLTCYYCNTTDTSCRTTVTCSRDQGYTRCARLEYRHNGSRIYESTCAKKSECTSDGITNYCNKRGGACRMECCAKNRCNLPSSVNQNIWSPQLACYSCSIHNWESCNAKLMCSGNEGYERCYSMAYNRIENGEEFRVMRTGCATHTNCSTIQGHNLCKEHLSNCKLQCCDNSSCNVPNLNEITSKPNLKCYKCSSKISSDDCNKKRVLHECNEGEDSCYSTSVVRDFKSDEGSSRMFYKGCTRASSCNSTAHRLCQGVEDIKSTKCAVKMLY